MTMLALIASRIRTVIVTRSRAPACTLSSVASSLRSANRNKIISALPLLLCLALPGCMGVTRVPARMRTPQGSQKPLDLTFLQTGQTTRTEVIEKLKLIDTGFQSDHFFLGRWNSSKWGGWFVAVGLGTSAGGAARFWHDVNLLVKFDEKGIVKSYATFPDQQLIEKLTAVAAESSKSSAVPFIRHGDDNKPATATADLVLRAESTPPTANRATFPLGATVSGHFLSSHVLNGLRIEKRLGWLTTSRRCTILLIVGSFGGC